MDNKQFVKEIADIENDFPQWYTDVIMKNKHCLDWQKSDWDNYVVDNG